MNKAIFRVSGKQEMGSFKEVPSEEEGKTTQVPFNSKSVIFDPVLTEGDENHENSKFWDNKPVGKIELGNISQEAFDNLETGKEYQIEITEVIKPDTVDGVGPGNEDLAQDKVPADMEA